MRSNMLGVTKIRIKHFSIVDNNYCEINAFLKKYDGNIIDIQYSQNNFTAKQIMVIYQEK